MIYVIHNNKGILLQYTGTIAIYCPSTFYEPRSEKKQNDFVVFVWLFTLKNKGADQPMNPYKPDGATDQSSQKSNLSFF